MSAIIEYREQVRERIKQRSQRKYNVWTVFGAKVAGKLVVNTTPRVDHFIWMEADPDVVEYRLVDQPHPQTEPRTRSPDAVCVMRNGLIEWRYVLGEAEIAGQPLLEAEQRSAASYGASTRLITIEALERNRILIENWRRGLAYLQGASGHDIGPYLAKVRLLVPAGGATTVQVLLSTFPNTNGDMLMAAIFKLAQLGEITTDFASQALCLDSHIAGHASGLPCDSRKTTGEHAPVETGPLSFAPTSCETARALPEAPFTAAFHEGGTEDDLVDMAPELIELHKTMRELRCHARKRLSRRQVPAKHARLAAWPQPDTSTWPQADQRRYETMHDAMTDYMNGVKVRDVERCYKVHISAVMQQLWRALQCDGNGEILGFCALVPHLRTGTVARRKAMPTGALPTGPQCTGGLMHLLQTEDLYESLVDQVLKRGPGPFRTLITAKDLQEVLVRILKARGYTDSMYPFNTREPLYSSLCRLINEIKHAHAREQILANESPVVISNVDVASGQGVRSARPRPLEDVEADEHKLHGFGCITITVDGIDKVVPVNRANGIVIVDRGSGAVLGASICLSIEAKEQSLIEAISSALVPGYVVRLPSGAAAPPFRACDFLPELTGTVWNTMRLDNAKIHTGNLYLDTAGRIGSQTCWGPIASWSGRPTIESVFSRLVCGYFAKLPSTTGAGTKYSSLAFPAEEAVKWNISLEMICRLFYLALAEINTTRGATRLNQTPIELLRGYVQGIRRPLLRRVAPSTASSPPVGCQAILLKVKRRSHNNPNMYVNYMGAKYTNARLSKRTDLLNEFVVAHIGGSLRTFVCFEQSGLPLGMLTADAPWGATEHTAEIRRLVRQHGAQVEGDRPETANTIIQEVIEVQARKVLHANEHRKKGHVVRSGLKLARMMEATQTKTVDVQTSKNTPPALPLCTTSSAAAFLRLARDARTNPPGEQHEAKE